MIRFTGTETLDEVIAKLQGFYGSGAVSLTPDRRAIEVGVGPAGPAYTINLSTLQKNATTLVANNLLIEPILDAQTGIQETAASRLGKSIVNILSNNLNDYNQASRVFRAGFGGVRQPDDQIRFGPGNEPGAMYVPPAVTRTEEWNQRFANSMLVRNIGFESGGNVYSSAYAMKYLRTLQGLTSMGGLTAEDRLQRTFEAAGFARTASSALITDVEAGKLEKRIKLTLRERLISPSGMDYESPIRMASQDAARWGQAVMALMPLVATPATQGGGGLVEAGFKQMLVKYPLRAFIPAGQQFSLAVQPGQTINIGQGAIPLINAQNPAYSQAYSPSWANAEQIMIRQIQQRQISGGTEIAFDIGQIGVPNEMKDLNKAFLKPIPGLSSYYTDVATGQQIGGLQLVTDFSKSTYQQAFAYLSANVSRAELISRLQQAGLSYEQAIRGVWDEQSAQAYVKTWQNYAQEMGMMRTVSSVHALDPLQRQEYQNLIVGGPLSGAQIPPQMRGSVLPEGTQFFQLQYPALVGKTFGNFQATYPGQTRINLEEMARIGQVDPAFAQRLIAQDRSTNPMYRSLLNLQAFQAGRTNRLYAQPVEAGQINFANIAAQFEAMGANMGDLQGDTALKIEFMRMLKAQIGNAPIRFAAGDQVGYLPGAESMLAHADVDPLGRPQSAAFNRYFGVLSQLRQMQGVTGGFSSLSLAEQGQFRQSYGLLQQTLAEMTGGKNFQKSARTAAAGYAVEGGFVSASGLMPSQVYLGGNRLAEMFRRELENLPTDQQQVALERLQDTLEATMYSRQQLGGLSQGRQRGLASLFNANANPQDLYQAIQGNTAYGMFWRRPVADPAAQMGYLMQIVGGNKLGTTLGVGQSDIAVHPLIAALQYGDVDADRIIGVLRNEAVRYNQGNQTWQFAPLQGAAKDLVATPGSIVSRMYEALKRRGFIQGEASDMLGQANLIATAQGQGAEYAELRKDINRISLSDLKRFSPGELFNMLFSKKAYGPGGGLKSLSAEEQQMAAIMQAITKQQMAQTYNIFGRGLSTVMGETGPGDQVMSSSIFGSAYQPALDAILAQKGVKRLIEIYQTYAVGEGNMGKGGYRQIFSEPEEVRDPTGKLTGYQPRWVGVEVGNLGSHVIGAVLDTNLTAEQKAFLLARNPDLRRRLMPLLTGANPRDNADRIEMILARSSEANNAMLADSPAMQLFAGVPLARAAAKGRQVDARYSPLAEAGRRVLNMLKMVSPSESAEKFFDAIKEGLGSLSGEMKDVTLQMFGEHLFGTFEAEAATFEKQAASKPAGEAADPFAGEIPAGASGGGKKPPPKGVSAPTEEPEGRGWYVKPKIGFGKHMFVVKNRATGDVAEEYEDAEQAYARVRELTEAEAVSGMETHAAANAPRGVSSVPASEWALGERLGLPTAESNFQAYDALNPRDLINMARRMGLLQGEAAQPVGYGQMDELRNTMSWIGRWREQTSGGVGDPSKQQVAMARFLYKRMRSAGSIFARAQAGYTVSGDEGVNVQEELMGGGAFRQDWESAMQGETDSPRAGRSQLMRELAGVIRKGEGRKFGAGGSGSIEGLSEMIERAGGKLQEAIGGLTGTFAKADKEAQEHQGRLSEKTRKEIETWQQEKDAREKFYGAASKLGAQVPTSPQDVLQMRAQFANLRADELALGDMAARGEPGFFGQLRAGVANVGRRLTGDRTLFSMMDMFYASRLARTFVDPWLEASQRYGQFQQAVSVQATGLQPGAGSVAYSPYVTQAARMSAFNLTMGREALGMISPFTGLIGPELANGPVGAAALIGGPTLAATMLGMYAGGPVGGLALGGTAAALTALGTTGLYLTSATQDRLAQMEATQQTGQGLAPALATNYRGFAGSLGAAFQRRWQAGGVSGVGQFILSGLQPNAGDINVGMSNLRVAQAVRAGVSPQTLAGLSPDESQLALESYYTSGFSPLVTATPQLAPEARMTMMQGLMGKISARDYGDAARLRLYGQEAFRGIDRGAILTGLTQLGGYSPLDTRAYGRMGGFLDTLNDFQKKYALQTLAPFGEQIGVLERQGIGADLTGMMATQGYSQRAFMAPAVGNLLGRAEQMGLGAGNIAYLNRLATNGGYTFNNLNWMAQNPFANPLAAQMFGGVYQAQQFLAGNNPDLTSAFGGMPALTGMMQWGQLQQMGAGVGAARQRLQMNWAFQTGQGLDRYVSPDLVAATQGVGPMPVRAGGLISAPIGQTGGFWGLQDQQRALQYARQDWMFNFQAQQMGGQGDMRALQLRQFMESWDLNARQRSAFGAIDASRLGLRQAQMYQGFSWQEADRTRQRAYYQQDFSFQRNQSDLQFGWQIEDIDEGIRMSSGRQRRQLLKQRERMTIEHNVEGERADELKKRQEAEWKIEDERYEATKKNTIELFELDKKQFEERRKFEDEAAEMQKRHFLERNALEEDQFNKSLEYLKKQKEWADEDRKIDEARIALERAHAKEQYDLELKTMGAGLGLSKALIEVQNKFQELQRQIEELTNPDAGPKRAPGEERDEFAERLKAWKEKVRARIEDLQEALYTGIDNMVKNYKMPEEIGESLKNWIEKEGDYGKALADSATKMDDLAKANEKTLEGFQTISGSMSNYFSPEGDDTSLFANFEKMAESITGRLVTDDDSMLNAWVGGKGFFAVVGGALLGEAGTPTFQGQWLKMLTDFTTNVTAMDTITVQWGKDLNLLGDAAETAKNNIKALWEYIMGGSGGGGGGSGGRPGETGRTASGFQGMAERGDSITLRGQRRTLSEFGAEFVDIKPSSISGRPSSQDLAEALADVLHNLPITLVVGDKPMDAYLKVKTRKLIAQEALRG